jgi:hypothetical protein
MTSSHRVSNLATIHLVEDRNSTVRRQSSITSPVDESTKYTGALCLGARVETDLFFAVVIPVLY